MKKLFLLLMFISLAATPILGRPDDPPIVEPISSKRLFVCVGGAYLSTFLALFMYSKKVKYEEKLQFLQGLQARFGNTCIEDGDTYLEKMTDYAKEQGRLDILEEILKSNFSQEILTRKKNNFKIFTWGSAILGATFLLGLCSPRSLKEITLEEAVRSLAPVLVPGTGFVLFRSVCALMNYE